MVFPCINDPLYVINLKDNLFDWQDIQVLENIYGEDRSLRHLPPNINIYFKYLYLIFYVHQMVDIIPLRNTQRSTSWLQVIKTWLVSRFTSARVSENDGTCIVLLLKNGASTSLGKTLPGNYGKCYALILILLWWSVSNNSTPSCTAGNIRSPRPHKTSPPCGSSTYLPQSSKNMVNV